jgi:HAD superfamily hydrolase (TIGR01509 family)
MNDEAGAYAGVIFDMDGILIDSEPLFRIAAQQAARDLGHEVSDELFFTWMGLPPGAVEASIIQTMGRGFPFDAFRDRFLEIWTEHTERYGVPRQPGIDDLLCALRARDIPFGVATSTRRAQAERSLQLAGLWDYIDTLVAGDEVDAGKPAPEIFLRAAGLIGVHAASCVALEDSEAGVRSASSAHMLTIMVPDLHQPSAIVAGLADYVLPTTVHAARVVLRLFDHHQGRAIFNAMTAE